MKTKNLFATILPMVIAIFITSPVYAKEQSVPDVHQIEEMTWTEIQEINFSGYEIVEELIRELSRVEAIYPNNKFEGYICGGAITEPYEIQYPICMTIGQKFIEETGIDIKVFCRKSSECWSQVEIEYTPNFCNEYVVTIGDEYSIKYGYCYYESAWNWGSGNSTLITEYPTENPYMYSGRVVKVSGIAYLNKYGKVIKTTTKEGIQVTNKENVMLLLSIADTYVGWYAPYNFGWHAPYNLKTDK